MNYGLLEWRGAYYLIRHKHFFALAALVPLLIWFRLLEKYIAAEYMIQIPLDRYIPFIPIFVVPYILWFVYIAFGCLYTGFQSRENYFKLLFFLGAGMSTAYVMYMILPNATSVRPVVYGGGIFSGLVRFIYAADTPTDVCPSVHVINAFAVDAALRHTEPFCKKRVLRYLSVSFFILICVSTLLIKQHSIFDVYCGLLVGGIFYIPLYKVETDTPAWFGKWLQRN